MRKRDEIWLGINSGQGAAIGRTVALGVLWNDSVSFLYHAKPGMSPSEAIGRVGLKDATTSGIGMVLLSSLPTEQICQLYENRDIPGFGHNLQNLLDELSKIKQQGYARIQVTSDDPKQNSRPNYTIAVAIGSPASAAIALSGWISEHDTAEIVAELHRAKKSIEVKL